MLVLEPRQGAGAVSCLAYASDGRTLASGHVSGIVCRWDLRRGSLIEELTVETAVPFALAFSPDGRSLAVGASGGCALFDIARNDSRLFAFGRGGKCSLTFSPGGHMLFFGDSLDDEIVAWEVESGSLRVRLEGPSDGVFALAHAPDAPWLACGGGEGSIRVWDIAGPDLIVEVPALRQPAVHVVTFSPDGTLLALGGKDRRVTIRRSETGDMCHALEGHTGTVWALAFSADGRTLLSGAADGTIRIWDAIAGRLEKTLDWQLGDVRQMALSPDGMTAAVSSFGPSILIWDLD